MSKIVKSIDHEKKLTTVVFSGQISADQFIEFIEDFYSETPTLYLLLDFSGARIPDISSDHLKRALDISRKYSHLRFGGKSAVITTTDLGVGMSRMYGAYNEISNNPIQHSIFKNYDDAMKWLLK